MDLVVPGMADLKDSSRNVKFSTKIFSVLESVGNSIMKMELKYLQMIQKLCWLPLSQERVGE